MAKYGKAAGKSVESAMHREKKGSLKSGKGGRERNSNQQEASDRRRAVRSPQERREGSQRESQLVSNDSCGEGKEASRYN